MSDQKANGPAARYAIGLDRGGTSIRVGLVRDDGRLLKLVRQRAVWQGPGSKGSREEQFLTLLGQALQWPDVAGLALDGIGVATGGLVNREGVLVGTCGAREVPWNEIPVREVLQRGLGTSLPVRVDIDTKAAAWGEYLFGAGRGARNVVYLAVGTGVGGGLILDGKLHHGAAGKSALAGHLTVNMHGPRAATGMMGTVEDYASGTAVATAARAALYRRRYSSLRDLAGGRVEDVTSEMVFQAARAGDALALEVIDQSAYALGITIAGLTHLLDPEVVIIGGGVADQGGFYLDRVRETVAQQTIRFFSVPVVPAALGNKAGVIGAAALFWD